MMYRFEDLVSDPDSFVNYLTDRFKIEFDEDSLEKGIILMDKRPFEEIIELDIKKMKTTLKNLGCKDTTIDFVVEEQKNYIDKF